jgi:hypothetical protein
MRKIAIYLLVIGSFTVQRSLAESPVIVAQIAVDNQTSPIPRTVILTPTSDAFYRVSVYLNFTRNNNSNAEVCLNIQWTDKVSFQTWPITAVDTQGG